MDDMKTKRATASAHRLADAFIDEIEISFDNDIKLLLFGKMPGPRRMISIILGVSLLRETRKL